MRLLWQTARRRAAGRELRQREIMGRRRKDGADSGVGGLMRFFMVLIVCAIHGMLGWNMIQATRESGLSSHQAESGRITLKSQEQASLTEALARQTQLDERKQSGE